MSPPEIADAFTSGCLSLGSTLSFVPPPGSIAGIGSSSDRRSSLFSTASRFRHSAAGITFVFHRSAGVLAYGLISTWET